MPYEIVRLWDAVPQGRAGRPRVDKYAAHTDLLSQIPEGKVASLLVPRTEYRAFSAAMRASGERVGKKVTCLWKGGSAYVSWETLTEANRSKRRGRPRTNAKPPVAGEVAESVGTLEPETDARPVIDDDIDPSLIGDLDAEVPPDVAAFQEEARRRRRRIRG